MRFISKQKLLILAVAGFLGAANLAFAQVAAKDQIFKFEEFSEGLVTKPSAIGLPPNAVTVAENVRFNEEVGSITKRGQIKQYGSADASNPILGMHRQYLKNGSKTLLVNYSDKIAKGNDTTGAFTDILTVSSGDHRWNWLTWHDIAIGTDGYNQPVKYDGSSSSATYLGAPLATDAGSGSGPDGTYTYKTTCYTSSYEVSLGVASNSVTVSDNDISLSMIPICPDTISGESIVGRKVYRTSDGGSTYVLLSNGTISDNTSTTLTDSDADGDRSGAYSPTSTYTPPVGTLILVHRNRLWIAGDPSYPSRLYYSEDGSHDYFKSDSYFNIRPNDGDDITFILNLLGKLTVGKTNSIQKVYTERADPDADWSISDPFSHIGCVAERSATTAPIGIIYLGNDGLYRYNGQYSQLISEKVTPQIDDISPLNREDAVGVLHENKYYLAYTSEESGEQINNRVLIYDLLSKAFTIDILDVNAWEVFDSGTDWNVLYLGSSEDGTVSLYSEDVHEVVHTKHADFEGTWDDARYIPESAGGNSETPEIEIAWTETIDDITDTIDSVSGIIDRPDTDGSYTSQYIYTNASTYTKLYWNETQPGAGGDVKFYIRSGATTSDTASASWQGPYSDPSGTDVSGATADTYMQYKVDLTTSNINYTPTLYDSDGYVIRLTYDKEGSSSETSVPFRIKTGWLDFGAKGYQKTLKKLYVYYDYAENQAGTLNITFENKEGDTDSFAIDLTENPDSYIEYFTDGKFLCDFVKITIDEASLNNLEIKDIYVLYDVEPIY